MLWSLHFAFLGIWPTHDADGNAYDPDSVEGKQCGKQLAHGLCLVMHAPKGDLDHLAKEWDEGTTTTSAHVSGAYVVASKSFQR